MYYYSKASKDKLKTCHEDLQLLFNVAINPTPHESCSVLGSYNEGNCFLLFSI